MPTLNDRGKLVEPNLPDEIPINYIVQYVTERVTKPPNAINPFLNRVLILEAKTAAGKSTIVPPEMFIAMSHVPQMSKKTVICTQPRILTTQELAQGLNGAPYFESKGFTFKLGENLGYQTSQFGEKNSLPGVLFVTLGTLEMQLATMEPADLMRAYSVIIIDEAHERSLNLDTTLCRLKQFYIDNRAAPQLPFLILMSATFDVQKYRRYFAAEEDNIIRVAGASFPIETRWAPHDILNLIEYTVETVTQCAIDELSEMSGTVRSQNRILIFVPGKGEGSKVVAAIRAKSLTHNGTRITFDATYLDSSAVKKVTPDYLRVVRGAEEPHSGPHFIMPCIVVNAVAETGLTLEDLKYVIDWGWSREKECNPIYNINDMLITKPAAQSRITQRKGRVGRKKEGVFLPLYTEETFAALIDIQIPDIIQHDCTSLILATYSATSDNINIDELLLDTPPSASLQYALEKLEMLGFLKGASPPTVTPAGLVANKLITDVSPESVAMILAGFTFDTCIDDLIVMAIMTEAATTERTFIGYSDAYMAAQSKGGKKVFMPRELSPDTIVAFINELFAGKSKLHSDSYFRVRALLADDFIQNLIIFRAFEKHFYDSRRISNATNLSVLNSLETWCNKNTLRFDMMLDIYNTYVAVKSNLVLAGIDIKYGTEWDFTQALAYNFALHNYASGAPLTQAVIEPITKLKMCIYSGFKLNLLIYDHEIERYRINYGGYPLQKPFFVFDGKGWINWDLKDYFPEQIIFYRSVVMENKSNNTYELSLKGLSVMSGFL